MTSSALARPSQTIPSMDERVSQFYDIQQTDMAYGDRALRIYSAVPYHSTVKRPVLYMLDGNTYTPKRLIAQLKSCQRINYRLL